VASCGLGKVPLTLPLGLSHHFLLEDEGEGMIARANVRSIAAMCRKGRIGFSPRTDLLRRDWLDWVGGNAEFHGFIGRFFPTFSCISGLSRR
jgi:hypothetical protein